MTTPPDPPPADAPADTRITAIEREQARQGGVLDRIIGMLGDSEPATTTTATDPAASAADMGEQMRQAVRDVNAEAAASAKPEPKAPEPEMTPREVMIRGKDRLQRALFGADPKDKR